MGQRISQHARRAQSHTGQRTAHSAVAYSRSSSHVFCQILQYNCCLLLWSMRYLFKHLFISALHNDFCSSLVSLKRTRCISLHSVTMSNTDVCRIGCSPVSSSQPHPQYSALIQLSGYTRSSTIPERLGQYRKPMKSLRDHRMITWNLSRKLPSFVVLVARLLHPHPMIASMTTLSMTTSPPSSRRERSGTSAKAYHTQHG